MILSNLTDNEIIKLWQNSVYTKSKKFMFNLYKVVNEYLMNKKLDENSEIIIHAIKFFKNDVDKFKKFIIEYINKLLNVIYKNINKIDEKIILYRGEYRKTFNHKINDILIYNTFHSTTTQIEIAYKFSETFDTNNKKIIFCIKYKNGSYCKKIKNNFVTYNQINKNYVEFREFEYLIPPNSYYCITDINKYKTDIYFVKMKLVEQEYMHLFVDKFYENKTTKTNCKNFIDNKIQIFVDKLIINKKEKTNLTKMKSYHINKYLYLFLFNNLNIFNVEYGKMKDVVSDLIYKKYDVKNNKKILNICDELTKNDIYICHKSDNFIDKQYYETIKNDALALLKLNKTKFNRTSIELYCGYFNIDYSMKVYDFIKLINSKKSGYYNKILISNISLNYYLYNCPLSFEPTTSIKSKDKTINMYYQHIILLKLKNIKIGICDDTNYREILILPPFNFLVNKKVKSKNKFNKTIYYYNIELF